MKRSVLVVLLIFVVLGSVFTVASAAVLAASGAYHPGDFLFQAQYAAESLQAQAISDPAQRADRYLELVGHRVDDLTLLSGTDLELEALAFLNADLDRAAVAAAQPDMRPDALLRELIDRLQAAVDSLTVIPEKYPRLYAVLQDKVTTLKMLASTLPKEGGDLSRLSLIAMPFPQDIQPTLQFIAMVNPNASAHPFPLVGQHALVGCATCHDNDSVTYKGVSADCKTCHAVLAPADHYKGDCLSCHSPVLWDKVHFDHKLVNSADCMSCHLERRPKGHFQIQCSFCHNTSTFKGAKPDHVLANATDCISCHRTTQPANHFDRQCSDCHLTTVWQDMSAFTHQKAGINECLR